MSRCALALVVIFLAAWPSPTAAQGQEPAAPRACADFRILSPGCRSVELYGQYLVEAWNFNERPKTSMQGVAAVFSTARRNGWGVALEVLGTTVEQRGPDAFVSGVSMILRRRLVEYGRVELFAEGGVGASYSTVIVPERGTRFNYLAQGGLGIATHLGEHVGTIVSLRVFHLSNASLNGPNHNPDIDALGGRLGLFVVF
jgi:hypothetical protein